MERSVGGIQARVARAIHKGQHEVWIGPIPDIQQQLARKAENLQETEISRIALQEELEGYRSFAEEIFPGGITQIRPHGAEAEISRETLDDGAIQQRTNDKVDEGSLGSGEAPIPALESADSDAEEKELKPDENESHKYWTSQKGTFIRLHKVKGCSWWHNYRGQKGYHNVLGTFDYTDYCHVCWAPGEWRLNGADHESESSSGSSSDEAPDEFASTQQELEQSERLIEVARAAVAVASCGFEKSAELPRPDNAAASTTPAGKRQKSSTDER